jgi:hypothetical protein
MTGSDTRGLAGLPLGASLKHCERSPAFHFLLGRQVTSVLENRKQEIPRVKRDFPNQEFVFVPFAVTKPCSPSSVALHAMIQRAVRNMFPYIFASQQVHDALKGSEGLWPQSVATVPMLRNL